MGEDFKQYLIPIGFVAIIMTIFFFFSDLIIQIIPDYLQFFLVGIPLFFVIFYYFEKSDKKSHRGHLLGLFLVSLGWDLAAPAYSVFPNGTIGSSSALFLNGTSVDFFIGNTLHFLGLNGAVLYFMTYVGFFAILYIAGKQVAKRL